MGTKNSASFTLKKFEKEVTKMSFESAMTRLEEITEILSSQKIELNEMVILFEEGKLLKNKCSKMLEDAKMRFEVVNSENNEKGES